MYTKNRIYVFDNFVIKMKVYLKICVQSYTAIQMD